MAEVTQAGKLTGYAAVFNQEAVIAGEFRECVAPGAFSEALARGDDCVAALNHDPNKVLGRTSAGTLRLYQDQRGLRYEIDPPATSYGRDVVAAVRRGELKKSSFAFNATDEDWVPGTRSKLPLRIVRSVRLWDISIVTWPAYEGTSVGIALDGRGELEISRMRLRLAENTWHFPPAPNVLDSRERLAAIEFGIAGSRR